MRPSVHYISAFLAMCCACGASEGQLKARAASDFGCAEERLQVREIDGSTSRVNGCGRSATYVETCTGAPGMMGPKCTWVSNSNDQASQTSAANGAAPRPTPAREETQSAPTGLGGFKFGMSKEDVTQLCNDEAQEFSSTDAKKGTCSAPVEAVGLDGELQMRFCQDKACMFRVRDNSAEGGTKGVLQRVVALRKALVARYGIAKDGELTVQSDCTGETSSVQCIKDGRAKADYEWKFKAGHRIRLRTRTIGDDAVVELRYDAPKRKEPGELSL